MAADTKRLLTEEEKIEQKVKMRRMISNILIAVALVSIIVFVVMMFMTKQNVNTQTSFDTQELRSKLKQIIALERSYYEEHGEYIAIKYLSIVKELERYNPNVDGDFKYQFDTKTGIATGIERDASHDVNGDEDGRDGLTLSINWEPGKNDGSDFFWPEEDVTDFMSRKASQEELPVDASE